MGGQLDKRMLHWQPAKCSIFTAYFNCSLLSVICRIKYFFKFFFSHCLLFIAYKNSIFTTTTTTTDFYYSSRLFLFFFSSYISLLQIVVSEMTGMCWWEHKTVLTLTSVTSMRTLPSDCQLFVSHASTLTRDIDMGILSVRLSVCPSVRPRSSYSGIVSKRLCKYQMIQVHNSTWRRLMLRSICIVNCT